MIYLLDVSTLIALLWDLHVHNQRVTDWESGQKLAVCPLTELGFLRISTQPTFGATVRDARRMLRDWKRARKPLFGRVTWIRSKARNRPVALERRTFTSQVLL
jgi:predicted nucleic acid-binding protein